MISPYTTDSEKIDPIMRTLSHDVGNWCCARSSSA